MAKRNTTLLIVLGFILVLAFGYFVWPTRYQMTTLQGLPVRIDRLTGCTQYFAGSGWVGDPSSCGRGVNPSLGAAAARQITYSLNGPKKLSAIGSGLTGTATLSDYGLQVDLYNGTPCTLRSGAVFLQVGAVLRRYDFSMEDIGPYSKGTVTIDVLEKPPKDGKFSWNFVSATYDLPAGTHSCT